EDPDPHVRMQLAYTLGSRTNPPSAGRLLGRLALRDQNDRYILAAVLSSVTKENLEPLLLTVLAEHKGTSPPVALVDRLLRIARLVGNTRAMVTLLQAVGTPAKGRYTPWQFVTLAGLLDTLDQRDDSLAKMRSEGNDDLKTAVDRLAGLFAAGRAAAADPKA